MKGCVGLCCFLLGLEVVCLYWVALTLVKKWAWQLFPDTDLLGGST